jgi:tight adherence protein B
VIASLPVAALAVGDIFVALAIAGLIFAAVWVALPATSYRLQKRLQPYMPADAAPADSRPQRRGLRARFYALIERKLDGTRVWRKLVVALERAGSTTPPAKYLCLMASAGLLLALVLVLLRLPPIVALLAIPLGALGPYLNLGLKAGRRQKAFDEQLPQLLMTLAASVRVGHSFRQAMGAVVSEKQEPASSEFARLLVETDIGRPLDEALDDMARRLGSKNFEYVIHAITIQREVGGSLGDLFDMTSETVRLRQQFTSKVKALTAMGRMSAYVLVAVPFIAVGLMSVINSEYTSPLFTTGTGHLLILVSLTGIGIGALLLRKIVSFRLA